MDNDAPDPSVIKRRFVVVGHKARTDGRFKLDDLCGSAGRLDILTRAVNASFMLSHSIRKDTELVLIMRDLGNNQGGGEGGERTILFYGPELRYLNPDERSTGALIRNALIKYNTSNKATQSYSGWLRSSPGIYISAMGFETAFEWLEGRAKDIIMLHEEGEGGEGWLSKHIKSCESKGPFTFVLSDHMDLYGDEMRIVERIVVGRVCIGPKSLHTDHCIVIVHNILDNLGY